MHHITSVDFWLMSADLIWCKLGDFNQDKNSRLNLFCWYSREFRLYKAPFEIYHYFFYITFYWYAVQCTGNTNKIIKVLRLLMINLPSVFRMMECLKMSQFSRIYFLILTLRTFCQFSVLPGWSYWMKQLQKRYLILYKGIINKIL